MTRSVINDKRSEDRYIYSASVNYSRLGPGDSPGRSVLATCTTVDLSDKGLGIHLHEGHLHKGSVISIRMPVPNIEMSVPVLGEVRFVNEMAQGMIHVGLRFISR